MRVLFLPSPLYGCLLVGVWLGMVWLVGGLAFSLLRLGLAELGLAFSFTFDWFRPN